MDDIENMSFEECLKMLEAKVKELETGNKDLDESIRIYEDAIALRKRCRKILDESEMRVQKLIETAEGVKREEFKV